MIVQITMFLQFVFVLAFLSFGESHSQCVQEVRSLKKDLKAKIKDVREEVSASREDVQEVIETKAAKDDIQTLEQNLTTGNQFLMDTLASNQNVTREELVRMLSDRETKEDAHKRASELQQALNFSIATGNKVIKDILMQIIASQETITNYSTAFISHAQSNHDQCVTRDEVQDLIQTEVKLVVQNQVQLLENYVAEIQQNNTALLLEAIQNSVGLELNPAASCENIPKGKPSKLYWIQGTDGSATQQYCDMTRTCCGRTGGWMKVANLDMKDTNQQCPSGFRLVTSPRRSCGRPGPSGCVSTTFPVHGVEYSRVCGKIIGYQSGTPDAFYNHSPTINGRYVDGVSLTHGSSPRKHIWTFAAAYSERRSNHIVCPCTHPEHTYTGRVPSYIGQDYFCETGSRNAALTSTFFPEDPLWDGQGCGAQSTCCSFNNPPWFCKALPKATGDNIEVRLCGNEAISNEDTPLEVIEIYVQ